MIVILGRGPRRNDVTRDVVVTIVSFVVVFVAIVSFFVVVVVLGLVFSMVFVGVLGILVEFERASFPTVAVVVAMVRGGRRKGREGGKKRERRIGKGKRRESAKGRSDDDDGRRGSGGRNDASVG